MKVKTTSLVIITLLVIFFTTCTTIDPSMLSKKPTIAFAGFKFSSITMTDMTLLFSLEIENPYPVTLYLDAIQSQLYIDGYSLMTMQSADKLKLPKNSKTIKTITVTVPYTDCIKAVKQYINKDAILVTIKGEIAFSIPRINYILKVPYSIKQQIPTIHPSVEIAHFNIAFPGLADLTKMVKNNTLQINIFELNTLYADIQKFIQGKGVSKRITQLDLPMMLSFDIKIKNKTKALLKGKSINYSFLLYETAIVQGQPSITTNSGVSTIHCATVLSTKHTSSKIIQSIAKKNIQYKIQGDMLFNAEMKGKNIPIPFVLNDSGSISW